MKKLLVIACVFIASYGYAQDLKFGVKAGLNLSNIVGDDVEDTNMKAGIYLGGFLNTSLNDRLSFQPELIYSRQGWTENPGEADLTFKMSYINIPLLLKMSLGASDKVHIYAGPQLGFLVNSELEADAGYGTSTQDIEDSTNKVDFNLNFGISFVGNDDMSFDIRYNRGLSKLDEIYDLKVYNSTFQFGVAYSF